MRDLHDDMRCPALLQDYPSGSGYETTVQEHVSLGSWTDEMNDFNIPLQTAAQELEEKIILITSHSRSAVLRVQNILIKEFYKL